MRSLVLASSIAALACSAPANRSAQHAGARTSQESASPTGAFDVQAHAFRPEARTPDEAFVAGLRLPEGFTVEVAARDLGHARMLAVRPDGAVYLTRPRTGDVLLLRDADQDGTYEARERVASNLEGVHGVVMHDEWLYLVTNKEVHRGRMNDDGTLAPLERLVDDLPDGGQHPNRTAAFGPDGRLYVSVGSSCNACDETNEEHATILVGDDRFAQRRIFARGLRNTIGFGWHPETREMWGMDHGSDWRGDGVPPEELNRLREGKHYGWPYAYGDRQADPVEVLPESEGPLERFLARTEPTVLEYDAHAAPIGMAFYDGEAFPERYRGDAFVAMRGSWNRLPPVGYEVVRIDFEGGEPRTIEPFLGRFLSEDGRAHYGRLAGVAVTPDGALLVTDDTHGVLYRVDYTR